MIDVTAIIFDLDGVITDTEELHARAEMEVCERHGIPCPKELWHVFKGRTTRDIFRALLDQSGRDDLDPMALTKEKVARYLVIAEKELTLIPHAAEFVRECKGKGYTLALTTSSVRKVADLAIAKAALEGMFDTVTTAEDVTDGKPNPEPYRMTAAHLGLAPDECAVIEDSDNGIRSAAEAGCLPIGITTSFPAALLADAGAAHVVHGFDELSLMLPTRP